MASLRENDHINASSFSAGEGGHPVAPCSRHSRKEAFYGPCWPRRASKEKLRSFTENFLESIKL